MGEANFYYFTYLNHSLEIKSKISDALITERSQSPTYTINHLLTVEGVKSRIAKKETFISKAFSSVEENKQTKFNLALEFGSYKKNFLSVYLRLSRDVFVKKGTFTALDVNSNERKSFTFRDFFDLSNFSLPDDIICIRSEIVFVSASQAST